jgi:hypothetical protein
MKTTAIASSAPAATIEICTHNGASCQMLRTFLRILCRVFGRFPEECGGAGLSCTG